MNTHGLVLSDSNARLVAARRLTSPRERRDTGRFLAEGAQAVREAIAAGRAVEIFATADAIDRQPALFALADGVPVDVVSPKAAASLSETVHPQGVVAVCTIEADSPVELLIASDVLAVVLVDANDPGNAGTILRTADAAGASVVVFAGTSVDPYNGKCVRASAGSLFHLRVRTGADAQAAVGQCRAAGLLTLATSGQADRSLDALVAAGRLRQPTAWVFGNEARGLPDQLIEACDVAVRVPIYGRAESLNLAAAAAICLYASAEQQAS